MCSTGGKYLVANTFAYKARKKRWTEVGNIKSAQCNNYKNYFKGHPTKNVALLLLLLLFVMAIRNSTAMHELMADGQLPSFGYANKKCHFSCIWLFFSPDVCAHSENLILPSFF